MASHEHGNVIKEYMKVFYTLCTLTVLTVVAAKMSFGHGQGADILHVTVGIIIAVIKVIAVMYIFMHLKFDSPLLRVFVYVPTFLFCALTFALNFLETFDYTYPTVLP